MDKPIFEKFLSDYFASYKLLNLHIRNVPRCFITQYMQIKNQSLGLYFTILTNNLDKIPKRYPFQSRKRYTLFKQQCINKGMNT